MSKTIKVISLLIVSTLLLALAIGTSSASSKVKILYWTGWGGSELEDLKKIIQEGFNDKRSDIEVETQTIFGAYEKLLAAIAGGVAPDVVSAVWDSQLASLAARGAILPLDNFAVESGIKGTDFWPKLWDSFHYDGKLYALAVTTNCQFIAYNLDMVKAAGLDPDNPPKTTQELDEWAVKLTKWDDKGNIKVLGYRPSEIALWGRLFGGSFYNEQERKITANDPKIVSAMEWLLSYNKWCDPKKHAAFSAGLGGYWSPENPFFAGKVAMSGYGEWLVQFGLKYNPKLKYGIFAFPTPDGNTNSTLFGGSMFVIPKNSKHPKEAWEFIKWITSEEPMKKICVAFTNMPPRINVAKSPEVLKAIPVLSLTIPLMEKGNAFTSVSMPIWQEYATALANAESMVINGQKTPKAALDEVTVNMQKELDKFFARR